MINSQLMKILESLLDQGTIQYYCNWLLMSLIVCGPAGCKLETVNK